MSTFCINVFGGDQENIVSWGEPVGNIGCGDYAVDQLPYTHQGILQEQVMIGLIFG